MKLLNEDREITEDQSFDHAIFLPDGAIAIHMADHNSPGYILLDDPDFYRDDAEPGSRELADLLDEDGRCHHGDDAFNEYVELLARATLASSTANS